MNWDASTNNHERSLLADFESWRGMTSLEDVAISRSVERNLIVDQSVPDTIVVAEMSSAAFRVAQRAGACAAARCSRKTIAPARRR